MSQIFSVPDRTALLNGYDDQTGIALAFRTKRELDYNYAVEEPGSPRATPRPRHRTGNRQQAGDLERVFHPRMRSAVQQPQSGEPESEQRELDPRCTSAYF